MTLNFTPAPLDDPLYYLRNFEWVLGWVRQRYGDLLPAAELDFIDRALALPDASRGLLVRMVMRKGELFRPDTLEYPELGPYPGAAVLLQQAGGPVSPLHLADVDGPFAGHAGGSTHSFGVP